MTDVEPRFKQPRRKRKGWASRTRRGDPAKNVQWRKVSAFVRARSGGRCEAQIGDVCTGRGEHLHHVTMRSRGGPDEEWNLLDVCTKCHGWIHQFPRAATALGFLRSSWEGR